MESEDSVPRKRGPKPKVLRTEEDRVNFRNEVDRLVSMNCTFKQIATKLHVDYQWILRWKKNVDYEDPRRTDLSPEELDTQIAGYLRDYPRRGERDVQSRLEADNIHITRSKLRGSIGRVDPEGRELRRTIHLHRREYSVPGPHYLWHLDGNHKLIKFRFVIHGAMDGFSRTIPYLRCATNNRASTVLNFFLESLNEYDAPLQIRCDKGGENVDVARFMFDLHHGNAHAVITGSSNHNQRIERLWRDVYEKEVEFYHLIFLYLADDLQLIDFTNHANLFVLHYLFESHINDALEQFRRAWNKHKMSFEHNRSPQQLYEFNQNNSYGTPVDTIFDVNEDEDVVVEDLLAYAEQIVFVEPVVCPLDDLQLLGFQHHFRPLRLADHLTTNQLIDTFLGARQFCFNILGGTGH